MQSERYSFSLTTFSPSGKLVQIEYALAAVSAGGPSVGLKVIDRVIMEGVVIHGNGEVGATEDKKITTSFEPSNSLLTSRGMVYMSHFRRWWKDNNRWSASNGVVIAAEKKQKSLLYDERTISKIEKVTDHIGMVYSGMGPDFRLLVSEARRLSVNYFLQYGEPIPTTQLVQKVASVMQEYTQSGGVRPFGVSLLICGWDDDTPSLYQCDPSGAYFSWKATAIGKNFVNGKTFLEKRYNDKMELEDSIHNAILTLKEGFEGLMTEDNIEVGVCNKDGFQKLSPPEVKDYLASILT